MRAENGEIVVSSTGHLADGKKLIAKVEEVIDDEKTGVHVKDCRTEPGGLRRSKFA
ncbi:MAG: hypothetical protein P4L55_02085 [Syntrophobacteraceae bacterium]|nr:hypothetical protein [Syntrophobacteraceae bacterium]